MWKSKFTKFWEELPWRRWVDERTPPCQCSSPRVYVVRDMNSYRSWCSDCGGRLWGLEEE